MATFGVFSQQTEPDACLTWAATVQLIDVVCDFTRKGDKRLPRRLALGSVLLQYRALTVVEEAHMRNLANCLNLFCLLALGHLAQTGAASARG